MANSEIIFISKDTQPSETKHEVKIEPERVIPSSLGVITTVPVALNFGFEMDTVR